MVDYSWSLAPLPFVLVGVAVGAYVVAWRAAGRRRAATDLEDLQLACMVGAALLALVALVSPIARLGEQMFGFHMLQHLLLLDFVPLLVALAVTPDILGPALAPLRRLERRLGAALHPAVVVALYAGGMWAWHSRPLFDLAMRSEFWHAVQHGWFVLIGVLFWWYVVGEVRPLRRPRGMGVFAFVTSTKLITGLLAATILGSSLARYPAYAGAPRLPGMSAAEDRALGGGMMLFEELLVMSLALAFMFIRMLGEEQGDPPEPADAVNRADRARAGSG